MTTRSGSLRWSSQQLPTGSPPEEVQLGDWRQGKGGSPRGAACQPWLADGRLVARCSKHHVALSSSHLIKPPPGILADAGGMPTVNGDGPVLDWAALVPLTVHPLQVTIIEAMEWIGEPVSATELTDMFQEPEGHYLSLVSYHMGKLVKLGAVEQTGHRPVRGARETFYFLASGMTAGGKA